MAGQLEPWTDRTPERHTSFDRPRTFGVAREAERMPEGLAPDPEPEPVRRPRRERGPVVTYLQMPWSYGDRDSRHLWHRMKCRCGRHEMCGGDIMQLAGELVLVERRCRWCDAGPGPA